MTAVPRRGRASRASLADAATVTRVTVRPAALTGSGRVTVRPSAGRNVSSMFAMYSTGVARAR